MSTTKLVTVTVAPGRTLLEAIPGTEHIVHVPGAGRTSNGATTEARTVAVDHKRYVPGDTLQLPEAEARRLADLGFVRLS